MKDSKTVTITKEKLNKMIEIIRADNNQRIKELENINEFGNALLLKWNQLEIYLKLNFYEINGKFPKELNTVLDSKAQNILILIFEIKKSTNYKSVFGKNKKDSALVLRNSIVHFSYIPKQDEYTIASEQIDDILNIVKKNSVDILTIIHKPTKKNVKPPKAN